MSDEDVTVRYPKDFFQKASSPQPDNMKAHLSNLIGYTVMDVIKRSEGSPYGLVLENDDGDSVTAWICDSAQKQGPGWLEVEW